MSHAMTTEIQGGARVYLRGCPHGKPGTVLKVEGNRVVVFWHDLDFLARHKPATLMAVESAEESTASGPPISSIAFG